MHIQKEEKFMKLLKVESGIGLFLKEDGSYGSIDSISKNDILRFLDLILTGGYSLSDYIESEVKNQAHQIIYKSLHENLSAFIEKKSSFTDESERLYLEDYKRYVEVSESST